MSNFITVLAKNEFGSIRPTRMSYTSLANSWEVKQRSCLQKHHIKKEFVPLQTLSHLFHLLQFVRCLQIFLEFNSKGLYQGSEKEKGSRCLVFMFSTKREISQFHVVDVQQHVLKSMMYVQSCCFANLSLLFFFPFLLPSSSSLLKLPSTPLPLPLPSPRQPPFQKKLNRANLKLSLRCLRE